MTASNNDPVNRPPATVKTTPTPAGEKCWIKHGFGDQICIREKGHDGFCRCASERGPSGTIIYSEWESRDGKFYRHVGYQTIYPANANR